MNSVKLLVVLPAAFILACGQTSPTQNIKITTANSAPANAAQNITNSVASNRTAARSAQVAEVADVIDDETDLYTVKCMICHKDTGKGGKVTIEGKTITPADLTSAKIKARSDEKLLSQIKDGVPDEGMPAFKGKLSDEEIKSIIQKIRKF